MLPLLDTGKRAVFYRRDFMSQEIVQMVLDVVFGTIFIYLLPGLFLLLIFLFSDTILHAIYQSITASFTRRR